MIAHAGLIAVYLRGRWRGALIMGPSGSGKSDLALRALGEGFRLVADDRTLLFVSRGRVSGPALFGRAPEALRGLIEIRGLGVLEEDALDLAPVALCVRCKQASGQVDRLPEPAWEHLLGVRIPVLDLWAFENSAPAKIRHAIEHLGAHP